MGESLISEGCSVESLVGRVADEFLRRQEGGERPDPEEYAARYPQAAGLLRRVLASLEVLDRSGSIGASGAETKNEDVRGPLGDFRIVREVGRGGMGVVYEAEQISLGRRVALKVLPFAATRDARQLQRFQNEARAAAGLHQEHIVPVHAVGCERGIHFYAMQFIDGQTLAQLLEQQRAPGGLASEPTATYSPQQGGEVMAETVAVRAECTPPPGAAATSGAIGDGAYFRRVAGWGVQAAEALEYAHALGIVHRDVKPGNLMVDGRGKLWVTDFGLARTAVDAGLTMTGDLLGTLRYMSPEQALARHGLVDHRTDVYSLGVTLYELLTLRPAVDGKDRQEILQRIAFDEPAAPRSLNRVIPAELETVVLKAMAKEPAERYATAKELADDLRRFLEDKPVLARRPTLAQRARKWGRRHRSLVVAGLMSLLLALILLGISNFLVWREKQATAAALKNSKLHKDEVNNLVAVVSQQRDRSDDQLQKALQAMSRLLSELEEQGPMPPVLSDHAIQFYETLLPLESNRPPMQLEEAWAHVRLGNLYARRNQFVKAEASYNQAYSLAGKAVHFLYALDAPPGDLEQSVATIQAPSEVEKSFRQALAHWRKTGGGWEKVADYRLALAFPTRLPPDGPLWKRWGRPGADRIYRVQTGVRESVLADLPTLTERSQLVALHAEYAQYLKETGHVPEARKVYLQALECGEKWESTPGAAKAGALSLANTLRSLGEQFGEFNAGSEAERAYRSAWKLASQWVAEDMSANSVGELLECYERYGKFVDKARHLEEGRRAFRRALIAREKQATDLSSERTTRLTADDFVRLGSMLTALEAPEDAQRACRAALRLYEPLRRKKPGEWNYGDSISLAYCHLVLGKCLLGERDKFAEYSAATHFYAEAFASVGILPGGAITSDLYNAACAAALAGCCRDTDADKIDSQERTRLRRQALDWLWADLAMWKGRPENELVAQKMQHWLQDPDFAGVRGAGALDRLPAAERQPWRDLWAEVERLYLQGKEKPSSK